MRSERYVFHASLGIYGVRISFDTVGPIDRPFVQIRRSLSDGAHFVLEFPLPPNGQSASTW